MSQIGLALYAMGMGFLGGFVGNVLAGWFITVTKEPSANRKWFWIVLFIIFAMAVTVVGIALGTN